MLPARTLSLVHMLFVVGLVGVPALAADGPVDFERDVVPLLEQHCIECHNPSNQKGDFSLATPEHLLENEFLVPGKADESELIAQITSQGDGERPVMPEDRPPLTAEQVDLLRRWIDQGAKWPKGLIVREKSKADATWWSLQPLVRPEPPAADGLPAAWRANPIDRFVFDRLQEEKLAPSPVADKRALLRRATYDLTGLPPSPDEVAAFLADDAPDAYERLVDRLLASRHYGERWGRHWLDVIRFGESRGFERNEIINNAWPFRDYVIRSINDDKPFDQFIREHLAGDVIAPDTPDVEVATTFLVCGPYDDVGNQDPAQAAQIRANTIDEIIRTTGEAFLGLTVGCARCHDHKFDPVIMPDYYALYATFSGVRHGSREVASADAKRQRAEQLKPLNEQRAKLAPRIAALEAAILKRGGERSAEFDKRFSRPPVARTGTEETFAAVQASFVRLVVEGAELNPRASSGYGIDEFEVWTSGANSRNVALASAGARASGAGRVANDFSGAYSPSLAIDGEFGARWLASGPSLTIALARPELIERVLFSSDRKGDAGTHSVARFVSEYRVEVSQDGKAWTRVADSHARKPVNDAHRRKRLSDWVITDDEQTKLAALRRELGGIDRKIRAVPALPSWWAGTFVPPSKEVHVFLGGDPQRKGSLVTPASMRVLDGTTDKYVLKNDAPEGERRLALADWIVSRKNPLTPRVLANRLWHNHFGTGIVATPSDFGYMGVKPTHPQLLDWLATELHRHDWRLKPLHRQIMLSRTYRQSAAFRADAAGIDAGSRFLWRFPPRRLSAEEIRDTMLSVSGKLTTQAGGPGFRLYRYLQDNVATYIPLDAHGPETYRRAVYHQNARAARIDLMTDFDQPDCAFSTPRRATTTTPLQALTTLNHNFTLDMARSLGERVQREAGDDPTAQVRRAYTLCYAREPSADEVAACVTLIEHHSLPVFCRVLLNTSELIYVR
ncbi:MAG: hypothetical protein CMJ48_03050 [Planctomycetaceae bacterium]|nr:hypothetical protein [Planctomycetaceae bacterium]